MLHFFYSILEVWEAAVAPHVSLGGFNIWRESGASGRVYLSDYLLEALVQNLLLDFYFLRICILVAGQPGKGFLCYFNYLDLLGGW